MRGESKSSKKGVKEGVLLLHSAHLLLHREALIRTAQVPQHILLCLIANRVDERGRQVSLRNRVASRAFSAAKVEVDERAAAVDDLDLTADRFEEGGRPDDRVADIRLRPQRRLHGKPSCRGC